MKSVSKLQYIVIGASILLFVLLFIANKKPEKKAAEQMPKTGAGVVIDIKTFSDAQISVMPDSLKKVFAELDKNSKDTSGLNALIDFFKKEQMPVPAAYYFEKRSELVNTPLSWFEAGNRYFYAVRFVRGKDQTGAIYQSAMRCFEIALQKDRKSVV